MVGEHERKASIPIQVAERLHFDDGSGGTGRRSLALEPRKLRQQDIHIVDVAEPRLICMHPLEAVAGVEWDEGFHDFRGVAELLERDPRQVNADRVGIGDASGGLG